MAPAGLAQEPALPDDPPPPPASYAEPVYPHPPSPRALPRDFDPYRPDHERYAPDGVAERGYQDYTYHPYAPYDPRPFDAALDRAYQQGVSDGRTLARLQQRARHGYAVFTQLMAEGDEAFAQGRYHVAVGKFRLAASLDQGDPTSRLGLGHSLFALGHYEDAARSVRRALELEPRIAHLPLDIRGAYGDAKRFRRQVQALRKTARTEPHNADVWFLMGYCYYFSGRRAQAAEALAHVVELEPSDRTALWLAECARTSAAADRHRRPRERAVPGDLKRSNERDRPRPDGSGG